MVVNVDNELGVWSAMEMVRKRVVKTVMSEEQHRILVELARRLGISESEMLRTALMDYAKELSMVKETVHRDRNRLSGGCLKKDESDF